ncbi:MAG: FAD-dependent monooxygenase [Acidimicrobiales bacterium]
MVLRRSSASHFVVGGIEYGLGVVGHSSVRTQVLIVGGGPVGLAMAVGLRHFGVDCLLVEQHLSTLDFPKGRGVNPRTMEILRQWDADRQLAAVALPAEETSFLYIGDTLLSDTFLRFPRAEPSDEASSPCRRMICSQEITEQVLRDVAVERGAEVRFGCRLDSFAQDADAVAAQVTRVETGEVFEVRCRYLVAADGVRGTTRERLGISVEGPGPVGDSVSILVDAPLRDRVADRSSVIYGVRQPRPGGGFPVVDNDRRWVLLLPRDVPNEPPEWFTEEHCTALVRSAIGDPDVAVRYIAHRLWQPTAQWATSLSQGRVFLVGDAAHVTTPAGGLGMNGGVADAHNLAWKLAGVLHGWASSELLRTYDAERRPAARRAAEASIQIGRQTRDENFKMGALGVSLGTIYRSDAIVPDGSQEPLVDDPIHDYVPSARPGHRAPHFPFDDGTSILDNFGESFVVLAHVEHPNRPDVERLALDVPFTTQWLPGDDWLDTFGITRTGIVVVRPDGYVSYRAHTADDPATAISSAIAASVCRGTVRPKP